VPGSLVGVTISPAKGPIMPARSALVVGAGVAALTAAFCLRRSRWDVVLLDHATSRHDPLFVLHGENRAAARRLGLVPALADGAQPDVAAVLRAALSGVTIRRGVRAAALVPDDCGVTVTFFDGDDEWFDLVVGDACLSDVDGLAGRIVHVGGVDELYAAELLVDAFDIFPDAETAVRWWRKQLRPSPRKRSAVIGRRVRAVKA